MPAPLRQMLPQPHRATGIFCFYDSLENLSRLVVERARTTRFGAPAGSQIPSPLSRFLWCFAQESSQGHVKVAASLVPMFPSAMALQTYVFCGVRVSRKEPSSNNVLV